MNITELTEYFNNYALQAAAAGSTKSSAASDAAVSRSSDSFQNVLDEEMKSLEEASKVSDLTALAGVLDSSVLNSMIAGSTDLSQLSEDLLNTSSGRSVMQQMIDSHFDDLVLSESDDDDEDRSVLDNLNNAYTEAVSDSEGILDALETLQSSLNSSTETEES